MGNKFLEGFIGKKIKKMKIILTEIIFLFFMITVISLTAMFFIKSDNNNWKNKDNIESTINKLFKVTVNYGDMSFTYDPEDLVIFMTEAIVPQDYISDVTDESVKIEYYKALSVVCRTNLLKTWKDEGCPGQLDYNNTDLSQIILTNKIYDLKLIKEASNATAGVVITDNISNDKDGEVIAAPFFTSTKGDLLAKEAGNGVGLSLNFAFVKAQEGLDFVDILLFFYEGKGLGVL